MHKKIFFLTAAVVLFSFGLYYLFYCDATKNGSYITLYGNVDVRQVDLSFRVNGRLQDLRFDEGDVVCKNALVANIEKDIYIENVAQLEAKLISLKTSLNNAERIYQRREAIGDTGAVSQEDLENTRTECEVLRANIKAIEAQLANAKTDLQDTEIYAPTDGTILTRIREPGSVLNASEPICTLSITSPVWIRAYVQEPDLGRIFPGIKAEIITDTKGATPYQGHLGFISPVAEFTPKSVETTSLRTELVYRLRVIADNPDKGLKQGMPVTVKLFCKDK